MRKIYRTLSVFTLGCVLVLESQAQVIMFDDFNYSGVNDAQIGAFNKWSIVTGTNGPPDGATYSKNNITFITDPDQPTNKLMTLSATVNGTSKATTHARIETSGYDYFEGTYAARVYFSETPYTYKDANIQTFYTIVDYTLGGDGSKYSEIDFEYMAADQWGTSTNKQVLYMTSWNRYIADPWQAWKAYFAPVKSYQGWHTLVTSATDKMNVKFWVDGVYIGQKSITDNDGTSVYPRSNMQVAFANWIWNNKVGSSSSNRTTTMQVDWVMYYKNTEMSTAQIEALVETYRTQGVQRQNLSGQKHIVTVTGLENESVEGITVYPNPSQTGMFHISYPVKYAEVTNLQGEIVLQLNDTNRIDMSNFDAGIYFLKIGSQYIKLLHK
jgi:hypothetical protein